MLYGAIIGDMAGSVWEFNAIKEKPKKLFMPGAGFTDDTVMTIAVADALMNHKDMARTLRKWGRKYQIFGNGKLPGYGGRFAMWLADDTMGAYNSFGNGSAMRASAAGWMASTLDEALNLAKKTAIVTHNHSEGIKGAQAVAGAVYMARYGSNKRQIKAFLEGFGYHMDRSCDEIRKGYKHDESCQGTIPEAMTAFIESKDFEDCLKLNISLGGDADTMGAIAGAVAEAYYGIPEWMIIECRDRLPKDMRNIIDEFERVVRG